MKTSEKRTESSKAVVSDATGVLPAVLAGRQRSRAAQVGSIECTPALRMRLRN